MNEEEMSPLAKIKMSKRRSVITNNHNVTTGISKLTDSEEMGRMVNQTPTSFMKDNGNFSNDLNDSLLKQ